ncbi:SRPBCC family protein [Tsukamurella paurometabola]|uniref:Polyketide cyclase / dehydrase and lipid transport n=1 Tax=Tsukamurella paurometabola TaxID=2061 RepID=A0A3P8KCM7_TSUPA|nr:SRPBCC family protein [Tsukamurella paurometabola]MBS4101756.1 SRPBCC family protein [Tsukamurella paurometabola]UEA84775.1 SRPBCC family protein [Tsukamurella paurometabola]VDR37358.1 Polyketide cyclase / dehydrase and lipid transport [Tsukamurella paurometabola]
MKCTTSIEIALPLDRVAQLLADPAQLPMWLRGMVVHEPVRGEHGEVGTVSRVVLRSGKRTMEVTETVTLREPADLRTLPEGTVVRFEREIEGAGMWNAARERLSAAAPDRTRWESENEYRFRNPLMRLMALLMPGAFRKQQLQHMEDFKAFAEQGTDVRDGGA